MAFTVIHSFTSTAGNHYDIKYDPDIFTIETDFSPAQEPVVTEAELGDPVGTVWYHHCAIDHKLFRVKAITSFPFAEIEVEHDSPSCGFVPPVPCDLDITGVVVTDESVQGAMDGTATVNTTGGSIPNEFSLDAIHWQTSNIFTDLVPGSYTVYARSADPSCGKSTTFVIGAGDPAVSDDIPWTEKLCYFFRLIRGGVTYPTREPIKWDVVNFVGKRDKDWHGWSSQYSDGVLELEFDCDAGKDVIEAEYAAKGNDGEVFFQYGYTFNAVDRVLFDGKLNLNTRKLFPQKVSCSVEKKDFNNLLQTRYETKVSMTATETIDGDPIVAAPVINFNMHAKQVVRNFKNQTSDLQQVGQTYIPIGNLNAYLQPETSSPQLSEIETYFGYPIGISTVEPVGGSKFNFDIKFDGDYTFNFNYTLSLRLRTLVFGSNGVTIKNYFRVNGVATQMGPTITESLSLTVKTIPIVISQSISQHLIAGDKVYFYTELTFNSAVGFYAWLDQTAMDTTAQSLESSPETTCNGWFIFDVINQCIKAITNNGSKLKSTFLHLLGTQQAADGDGSLYIVTNGKQIRQFETDKNPLKISAKDPLEAMRAIFCLGMGQENTGGVEVIRVERANYFYRNKQIIVIDECWDYSEEVAKDIIYNEFEFGYDKFQEDGFNTLDEFNTKHEYVGPIKTNKLKLVQKSKLITSGYSIESSRRQQFSDTASDSYQNDEEGFLIAMRRVTPAAYIPEKDENFSLVANVISPSTVYNLRVSPLRMIINWAIWIYNIFHYKPSTDKMKCTFVAQNGELRTRLQAADVHPVGDLNKAEWQEDQEVLLTDLVVEERIWRPEWINFKARLTADKIERIEKAMRGAHPEDINYGYIVVKDHNGEYQGGFIYELNYNFHTENAGIKMLKKFDSPVVPGATCCQFLVLNGCYIKINGNKIIV